MDVREALAERMGLALGQQRRPDLADIDLAALAGLVGDGALRFPERECPVLHNWPAPKGEYTVHNAELGRIDCPSCDGKGKVRKPVVVGVYEYGTAGVFAVSRLGEPRPEEGKRE